MSGDLSNHPMFAKRRGTEGSGASHTAALSPQPSPALSPNPALSPTAVASPSAVVSPAAPAAAPALPTSRPSLPRTAPTRASLPPGGASASQPSTSPRGASPAWQAHGSQQPSSATLSSLPQERVLALQSSGRSSPSSSVSAPLGDDGGAGLLVNGANGGAAAASSIPLRDPAELIMAATDESLKGVSNWGLNIRICDLINNTPAKCDYLLSTLLPRVTHRDHSIGITALALLESIVKNCPVSHPLVGRREVLDPIVAILPKPIRDPNHRFLFGADQTQDVLGMERYDRLLVVIQLWGKSFAYNAKAPGFMEVYKELLHAGVKFAEPDRDELAPVFTPPPNHKLLAERVAGIATGVSALRSVKNRNSASPSPSSSGAVSPSSSSSSSSAPQRAAAHGASSSLSGLSMPAERISESHHSTPASQPSPRSRLTDPPIIWTTEPQPRDPELAAALSQVKLLLEMLDNSDSPAALASDDIASMLVKELKKAQDGVMAKLQKPSVEDRIQQLLQMNDALVNTLAYYDGLVQGSMRRRDDNDEARRALHEQDEHDLFRPHVKRQSSYDMQSHDIKLIRDNEEKGPRHQYQSEAAAPSFSYATGAPPGQSPAAGRLGEPFAGRDAPSGLSQFLTSQGLRSPSATSPTAPLTSPVSAPPMSSPGGLRSPAAAPPASARGAGVSAAAAPKKSLFSRAGGNNELLDLVAASGPAPSYAEVVQPYRPEPYRPSAAAQPLPSSHAPTPSMPSSVPVRRSASNTPQSAPPHSKPAAPAALSPAPQRAPAATVAAPTPAPAAAAVPLPMAGGMPLSPEQYAAWYAQMMAQQQAALQQQQQPQPQALSSVQGEHDEAPAYDGGVRGEEADAPYGEQQQGEQQQQPQGERGEQGGEWEEAPPAPALDDPNAPPLMSQSKSNLHQQFGQMSMR